MNGGEVKTEKKEVLKVKSENGVIIQGASGLLMRIAKCCNPVPGDEIEGYITKGRGSLFTVQIVIISRVKKVMNNV